MKNLILIAIAIVLSSVYVLAQPSIDGLLTDPQYSQVAIKLNTNAGWGPNINVYKIVYFADYTNSQLYLGVEGKLDGSGNGIGVWLNVTGTGSPSGKVAGQALGISGGGHYIGGNGGSNMNFKADFEVDYMFAFNNGGGTTCWFDAGKHVGSSIGHFQGSSNLIGTPSTNDKDTGYVFTLNSITFAFDNAGTANMGLEMRIPFSEIGATSAMDIEVFAFIVSSSAWFSDITVPGNKSGDPGFDADWGSYSGTPYHSTPPSPLPIQLASFVGSFVGNGTAKLEWETISEVNNYGFNVQRLNEASKNFETIGFVEGKGTTLESQSYEYIDVQAGTSYRLEQIDNDGLTTYYGPIMLNPNNVGDESVPAVFALNQNYPNPFNPSTTISFSLANSGNTTLKIYNVLGNEVATLFNGNAEAGKLYNVKFDATKLSTGMYIYKLQNGTSVKVRKLTLVK
jgi:hypothetical protein